jgi:hypothetical protein
MATRTEEIASTGTGAAQTVKPAVESLHGVFKQLAQEHGEIAALLMRFKATSNPEVRRALFAKIRTEMLAHDNGEIHEVYPAFEQYAELKPMAKEHNAEAKQLEQLLEQLNGLAPTDASWAPLFDKLVELAARHTREEEDEYFPTAERVLGQDEAERLQGRYEAAKAAVTDQASELS